MKKLDLDGFGLFTGTNEQPNVTSKGEKEKLSNITITLTPEAPRLPAVGDPNLEMA